MRTRSAGSPAGGWQPFADLILVNANVVTVDAGFSSARAVAIKDGRIIAVGTSEDVVALRGGPTRVIDVGGRTVIPGLQDSHIHFVSLGHDLSSEVDLTTARTGDDLVNAVARVRDRVHPGPGQWIVGSRWDQHKYPKMPTRWQLDAIAPENPIILNRTWRGVAVNSATLRLMGIRDQDPRTWPSWWLADPSNFTFEDKIYRTRRRMLIRGKSRDVVVPTGVFLGERAAQLVTARPPTPTFEQDVESVRVGSHELLSLGVTSIIDPSSRMGYGMRVYQEARDRGWIALRVSAVYEGTFKTQRPSEIRRHMAAISISNLGDAFLRWRGAKFYADGGVGTRSAWMSEPFEGWQRQEGEPNEGAPVVRTSRTRESQFRAALDHGWDLHTHCCGDRAMRQTVDLYRKLLGETGVTRASLQPRWSIIHAYMPIEPKTMVLPDMAELGIVAVVNPVFNWQQGLGFATNLGDERMARCQPFRSYMRGGVVMASGSDYPVTSHDPWHGIYALLTRRDQSSGKVYGPHETVPISDALRSYTINGAYLTYEEAAKGSVEVGKLADLVVLDISDVSDLERDPELCFAMRDRVLMTLVDGEVRYRNPRSAF